MLNARDIIIDAFYTAGVVSEGDLPDGTQSQIGLNELNDVIYSYNLDNYFPFTRTSITCAAPNIKNEYSIGLVDCDFIMDTPVLINKLYARSSSNTSYNDLKRTSYEQIFSYKSNNTSTGMPCVYSYDRTWPNGRLVFNVAPTPGYILTMIYNKVFPELNFNSDVDVPPEYNDLLKNSLAEVLMKRYKMDPNVIQQITDNVNSSLDKIKRRNQIDKIITWGGHAGGGANDAYYNLLSPKEWS